MAFDLAPVRSSRAEVRNPVLALSATRRLLSLAPEVRAALADVLGEIADDAQERAQKCWRTHKAPMAAYWKAVAVYAGHTRRALRKSLTPTPPVSQPDDGKAADEGEAT